MNSAMVMSPSLEGEEAVFQKGRLPEIGLHHRNGPLLEGCLGPDGDLLRADLGLAFEPQRLAVGFNTHLEGGGLLCGAGRVEVRQLGFQRIDLEAQRGLEAAVAQQNAAALADIQLCDSELGLPVDGHDGIAQGEALQLQVLLQQGPPADVEARFLHAHAAGRLLPLGDEGLHHQLAGEGIEVDVLDLHRDASLALQPSFEPQVDEAGEKDHRQDGEQEQDPESPAPDWMAAKEPDGNGSSLLSQKMKG